MLERLERDLVRRATRNYLGANTTDGALASGPTTVQPVPRGGYGRSHQEPRQHQQPVAGYLQRPFDIANVSGVVATDGDDGRRERWRFEAQRFPRAVRNYNLDSRHVDVAKLKGRQHVHRTGLEYSLSRPHRWLFQQLEHLKISQRLEPGPRDQLTFGVCHRHHEPSSISNGELGGLQRGRDRRGRLGSERAC